MGLELSGFNNSTIGGADVEEVGVEGEVEGKWGGEKDGNGFGEAGAAVFEVGADDVGYGCGVSGWRFWFDDVLEELA